MYIVLIYFLFPETKGRTLEEIGKLFGDTHIAHQWYGISEEERHRIAEEAAKEMEADFAGNGNGNGSNGAMEFSEKSSQTGAQVAEHAHAENVGKTV